MKKKIDKVIGAEYLGLTDIIMVIRNYIEIVIGITFIFTLAGIFFAKSRAPEYRAKTTLMVSSGEYYSAKNINLEELNFNQKLATTYIGIAGSPSVLNSVIKNLDLNYKIEELNRKIDVKPIEKTEFIEIIASDSDPVIAMRIANETGKIFGDKIKEVMTFKNIKVVEEATVPRIPQPKKTAIIGIASFLLGVLVSVSSVFIYRIFYSKLCKPEEIEDILQSSVLMNMPLYQDIEKLENLYKRKGGENDRK
ncbi:MAG: YveK family protein [Fusobacteriaceae bacterium]